MKKANKTSTHTPCVDFVPSGEKKTRTLRRRTLVGFENRPRFFLAGGAGVSVGPPLILGVGEGGGPLLILKKVFFLINILSCHITIIHAKDTEEREVEAPRHGRKHNTEEVNKTQTR